METLVAGSIFMVLVSGVLAIIIYMLPWFIALMRGSKSTVGIFFSHLYCLIGQLLVGLLPLFGQLQVKLKNLHNKTK